MTIRRFSEIEWGGDKPRREAAARRLLCFALLTPTDDVDAGRQGGRERERTYHSVRVKLERTRCHPPLPEALAVRLTIEVGAEL